MKKTLSLLAGAALLFLAIPQANATTYTFTDHWNDWPGYTSNHPDQDVIGNPQVEKMVITTTADLQNGTEFLNTVSVYLTNREKWDSLFINSYNKQTTNNNWDDWDYFVHNGSPSAHSDATNGTVPNNGLYNVKENYVYTTVKPTSTSDRNNNPNGIDASSLTALDSAFAPLYASDVLTYDLTNYNIDVSDGFFFAYAPWCSNDVMGTPEPATMLLFGTGLIGLIGIGRRRSRRS